MAKITNGNESPFHRLQRELGDRISAAEPGEQLPPEPELARQMGVSRSTLREAMRSFEAQGLLMRRQGAGTFVVDKTDVFETGLEVLESLETIAERSGLQISMGGLDIMEFSADDEIAEIFDAPIGSKMVSVTRVINAKGRAAAYLQDILPAEILAKHDLDDNFSGSILDLLIKREDISLGSSHTEIKAEAATSTVARALHIQRGDVLLLLEADLTTDKGKIIDHSYSYFLPGYFRLFVNRRIGII